MCTLIFTHTKTRHAHITLRTTTNGMGDPIANDGRKAWIALTAQATHYAFKAYPQELCQCY